MIKIFYSRRTIKLLGYSIKSIYFLTSTRKIPHYKPNGRKIFFKKDEINHWISKGKIKTDDELHEESLKYRISYYEE